MFTEAVNPQQVRFINSTILERLSQADRHALLLIAEAIRTRNSMTGENKPPLAQMVLDLIKLADEDFLTPKNIRRCLSNSRYALMCYASNLKAERYIRDLTKHARIDEESTLEDCAYALICFYESFTYAALLNMRDRINRCMDKVHMSGHEYYAMNGLFGRVKVLVEAEPEFVASMGEEVALIPRYVP